MNSQKKVLVVGCSYTKGHGLPNESNNPDLWVNKLFPKSVYNVHNTAKTGANNQWIFLETMSHLLKNQYDIVLVAWTAIPRYNFHVGLELYSVDTMLRNADVNINDNVKISGKWLESVGNSLLKLHNDHWDLLDLIKYVNVLIDMQQQTQGRIFFVNALGPWSENYFQKKNISLPSDLSSYEQNLLQVNTRDDPEIFQLYEMIHNQYNFYGGICEQHWLNLYCSLHKLQIDTVSLQDPHPGYASQEIYAKYLAPILTQKLQAT